MLTRLSPIVYLHGFASGPSSRKARFFAQHLFNCGIEMLVPDLAEGNFENLSISSQLALMDRLIEGRPVTLIGSSLGGYLAALYASKHSEVERLVLLAPAFGFLKLWEDRLGPDEMNRWRATNTLSVYHYGDKQQRNLGYQLMADAKSYPLVPGFSQPALLFHGLRDDTVPMASSIAFVNNHPNAKLVELDSDHELGNVLDRIWQETQGFLL